MGAERFYYLNEYQTSENKTEQVNIQTEKWKSRGKTAGL